MNPRPVNTLLEWQESNKLVAHFNAQRRLCVCRLHIAVAELAFENSRWVSSCPHLASLTVDNCSSLL